MIQPRVRRAPGSLLSIYSEMSERAVRAGAVNLGQGFPDWNPPADMLAAADLALRTGNHQYPPVRGTPELRAAVARHAARWHSLHLDPDTDVLVTVGATEGITAALLAFAGPGDEVIMLEPFYDGYSAAVELAGATAVGVRLETPGFTLDPGALEAAATPRTRVLLLNTPHNPTGRVLSRAELEPVAAFAARHDLMVIVDEVYEHLVYDGHEHVAFATLPGMRERTISVSSAAKTFSATGWKIGWLSGPAERVSEVVRVKQYLSFTTQGPFQTAVAAALDGPDAYFSGLCDDLARKRDHLCEGLTKAGFAVTRPAGGYFVMADISSFGARDAREFCLWLNDEIGVTAIPATPFYSDPAAGVGLVRFAFCKSEPTLAEAVHRLTSLSG